MHQSKRKFSRVTLLLCRWNFNFHGLLLQQLNPFHNAKQISLSIWACWGLHDMVTIPWWQLPQLESLTIIISYNNYGLFGWVCGRDSSMSLAIKRAPNSPDNFISHMPGRFPHVMGNKPKADRRLVYNTICYHHFWHIIVPPTKFYRLLSSVLQR
jgi:hypothetical protein